MGARGSVNLYAGCDEQQRLAIASDAAPLLIVAGAGSGKTRVLTRRIARRVLDGSAQAPHTLALTFTRKAAAEMRQRLYALGLGEPVAAGTFHAIALRELRRRAIDREEAPPVVLESKARLLAKLLPDRYAVAGSDRSGRMGGRRDVLSGVAAEIEWAKARCVAPDRYLAAAAAADRSPALEASLVVDLYASYEREKRKRRVLDFDDLLIHLARAIEEEPDFAASQRWRFRHLFVDELQDANAAQLRLLDAWLAGRDDLCAVGDPRQAIYGWNGADADAIAAFAIRHPGATTIALDANYRSTPQVVSVAAAALAGPRAALPPTSQPDGPVPSLTAYTSDDDEAAGVAVALRRAHAPGRSWSQCAVLTRTNAQLVAFEKALTLAAIPYRSGGGAGFLTRPAVREALAAVRDPGSTGGFIAFLDDLELEVRAEDAPTSGEDLPSNTDLASPERAIDRAVLARLAREYDNDESRPNLTSFLAWARASLRSDPLPGEVDAVTLSTFHRAKGLEWPVVFVAGLEDGFIPISQATSVAAVAEERRLLYVALSRSSHELHCSWARTRTFGTRTVPREPSPYLAPIETARAALEREATPDHGVALRAIAENRAMLAAIRSPRP